MSADELVIWLSLLCLLLCGLGAALLERWDREEEQERHLRWHEAHRK